MSLGEIQRRILWEIDGEEELGALMERLGYPDRRNLRRSIKRLERGGKVETRLERGEDGRKRLIVRCGFLEGLRKAVEELPEDPEDYAPSYYPRRPDDEEEEEDWGDPEAVRRLREEVWREAAKPLPGDEPEPDGPDITADQLEALFRAARDDSTPLAEGQPLRAKGIGEEIAQEAPRRPGERHGGAG